MTHFIVASHGWSASNWTAHSLNLNEDVLCVHSARAELAEDKKLQSNQNLKKHINQLQKGYFNRQQRSLDEIYNDIEKKGSAKNYGSVHVLRLRDIPIISEKFGLPQREFKLANVVRHPVDLVWSGYGQFKDLFRYDINELHWTSGKIVRQALKFANEIGNKYDLNIGDFEVLAFFGACAVLESLKLDLDAYKQLSKYAFIDYVGTFQMEKITSDKGFYHDFCLKLGLENSVNQAYINQVFNLGIINKHKHDNQKLAGEERFKKFSSWQKEVFLHFFDLHGLKSGYESFGYDFNFLFKK